MCQSRSASSSGYELIVLRHFRMEIVPFAVASLTFTASLRISSLLSSICILTVRY